MDDAMLITDDLRHWIISQAQAGCTPHTLIQAMLSVGWKEPVAVKAIDSTLREHLAKQTSPAMPNPHLDGSPLNLDVGDKIVTVLASMQHPRIVMLEGFLSDQECDALIELALPKMLRSKTVVNETGGEQVHASRTSEGMFFQRGENELVKTIETRIAKLVNWPVEHGEGLQVLHYKPGAEYKPHYDYFDPAHAGSSTILQRGGQRLGTVLLYLNNPEKGGGTVFPDAGGFEASPRKGNAVFFSYSQPHPDSKSLHGGSPVIAGEKWVATKWLREHEFR